MTEHDWRKALTKQRMKITRQRRAVEQSLKDRDRLVRAALDAGLGPTKVAQYSGIHISRVSQIAHAGECPHTSICRYDFGCDGCCKEDNPHPLKHAGTLG